MLEKIQYSKEALEWAEKNLIGKSVFRDDIKKHILFTRQGVKHAVNSGSNNVKSKFIYDAFEKLKSSVLIDIQNDNKNRRQIKKVYVFFNEWTLGGESFFVRMYAREGENGTIYYDHSFVKKKKP